MEKIRIKINIAGRIYPLNIPSSEEEIIRRVAKQIEGMIKKFEANHNVKDKQDVLAMCAIQLGTNAEINLQNYNNKIEETNQRLRLLTNLLEGDEIL